MTCWRNYWVPRTFSYTNEPDPLLKVDKELVTLKTKISELRTEFINTKQTVENLSTVDNTKELANIQEKLQKVDTKQLATDDFIDYFGKNIRTLQQITPTKWQWLLVASFLAAENNTPVWLS